MHEFETILISYTESLLRYLCSHVNPSIIDEIHLEESQ